MREKAAKAHEVELHYGDIDWVFKHVHYTPYVRMTKTDPPVAEAADWECVYVKADEVKAYDLTDVLDRRVVLGLQSALRDYFRET